MRRLPRSPRAPGHRGRPGPTNPAGLWSGPGLASLLGLVALVLAATPAAAQDHARVTAAIDAALAAAGSGGVTLDLASPAGPEVAIDQPVELVLTAGRASDTLMLVVDALGVVQPIVPPVGPAGDGRLGPGEPAWLPPRGSGQSLTFSPPLGPTRLYLLAWPAGTAAAPSGPLAQDLVPVDQAAGLAGALVDLAASVPLSVAHRDIDVVGRGHGATLTAVDIVSYFTIRSRSIDRPELNQPIEFAFNSADLTPESETILREWVEALKHPELRGEYFVLEGHTDDVGSDDYNLELSRRRAQSVLDYLITAGGLSADRFRVTPRGEAAPLVPNTDDTARARNRRVEFQLM